MNSVFVVFSGEYELMQVETRQLEGTLPAFRIEGVFSSPAKCDEWIDAHDRDISFAVMSYVEIPLDPVYSERESEMQVFQVRMNQELHIMDIKMGDESDIPEGKLFTFRQLESGDIQGAFFARDLIDACKLSFLRVKEAMGR